MFINIEERVCSDLQPPLPPENMRRSSSPLFACLGYFFILVGTQLGSGVIAIEPPLTLDSRSISSDAADFAKANYDYIIIGGGTAGLALAARLSESGKHFVGVLEAGISGYGDPLIDIPGNFGDDIGTIYDCKWLPFHIVNYF